MGRLKNLLCIAMLGVASPALAQTPVGTSIPALNQAPPATPQAPAAKQVAPAAPATAAKQAPAPAQPGVVIAPMAIPERPCMTLEQLQNSTTPVEIIGSSLKCIREGKYDNAAEIFVIAGAYSKFDKLRVTDKADQSAKAAMILGMKAAMTQDQQKTFGEKMQAVSRDSAKAQRLCQQAKRLGAPSYNPTYMTQSRQAGGASPLVANFDAAKGWNATMKDYMKCAG